MVQNILFIMQILSRNVALPLSVMHNLELLSSVARQINSVTGESIATESCRSVSGGCINDAWIVSATSGANYFVKFNRDAPAAMFSAEADGLNAMRATGAIRVPEVITFGELDSGGSFLVLDSIQTGSRSNQPRDYFETFGRSLAEMHRLGTSERFGFESDNWLGSSVQLNPWMNDWSTFWIEARLVPQLKMARDTGHSDQRLQTLGDRLINRIGQLLNSDAEPPALIHGDLWSENYLADENGKPAIFDPACYYANREAEFGMTKLFGGFPQAFYDAYHEAWPLSEGWETRVELYTLYHLLNHLNLFGRSYLGSCLDILERHT